MGMWHKVQSSATFIIGSPIIRGKHLVSSLTQGHNLRSNLPVWIERIQMWTQRFKFLFGFRKVFKWSPQLCLSNVHIPASLLLLIRSNPSKLREGLCSLKCVRAWRKEGIVNRKPWKQRGKARNLRSQKGTDEINTGTLDRKDRALIAAVIKTLGKKNTKTEKSRCSQRWQASSWCPAFLPESVNVPPTNTQYGNKARLCGWLQQTEWDTWFVPKFHSSNYTTLIYSDTIIPYKNPRILMEWILYLSFTLLENMIMVHRKCMPLSLCSW